MSQITLIMTYTDRIADHVVNVTFTRENVFRSKANWDDIQKWIADGHTVVLRPPTDEERTKLTPRAPPLP